MKRDTVGTNENTNPSTESSPKHLTPQIIPASAGECLEKGDRLLGEGHFMCGCALLYYSSAADLCPTSAEAHAKLGSLFYSRREYTKAIPSLIVALNLHDSLHETYCDLAHSYQIICYWHEYENRMRRLAELVAEQLANGLVPTVHPWHAATIYNLPLAMCRDIAVSNAQNCLKKLAKCGLLEKRDVYARNFLRMLIPV